MKWKDLGFIERYLIVLGTMLCITLVSIVISAIMSNINTTKTNTISKLYYRCVMEMSYTSGDVDNCDSLK